MPVGEHWAGLASVPGAAHQSAGSTRDDMVITSRQRLAAAKIGDGTVFRCGGTAGFGRNGRGADGSGVVEAGSGSGGKFPTTARMVSSGQRRSLAGGTCGRGSDREGEGGTQGRKEERQGAARPDRSWLAAATPASRREGAEDVVGSRGSSPRSRSALRERGEFGPEAA